jgi:hypothetical protein
VKAVVEGTQHSAEIITGKARNLDTRCLSVDNFKLLPVTSSTRAPGGCLGLIASLQDAVQKENFLRLPGIEPKFLGHPARNLRSRGGIVVKELRYKPAGCGFDSRWCHWNFPSHNGPGVDSASNRNEYQVYFLGVKVAGA